MLNPLKRRIIDAGIDYPRRRATIACEVCRSRKSRCDGTKPKCRLCTELGAECVYREPGVKLDAGDKLILEQLNRIESLLQMMSNGTGLDGDNGLLANPTNVISVIPNGGFGTWTSGPTGTNISTMPKCHTNATMHLLQWPLIRDLVSRPYDPQILLQLEMAREPLHSLTKTPCVDLSNTQAYIEAYFERVNVWYACVNPYSWKTCGAAYHVSCHTRTLLACTQCHLLAAAYLFYLVRPLEAWNLLCTTSTKLQLLLMAPNRIPPQQRELVERIYWNALLFESDLLAELDLPHSGVVQFEENVGLPGGFEGDEQTQVGRDELCQLIYSKDSMSSTTSLEPVVAELDYQLNQWYESLPGPLQFPFARTVLPDPVQTVLRLRFFACRTIIYRPYILAVLENEQAVLDAGVRDCCHKCLEACIRQLEHIVEHHAGHMPYIWQGALSMVSQSLLIMGATMSPSLLSILLTLVSHRDALDELINGVIAEVEHYAALAPSLSLAAEIIKEAEVRRRAYLNA
ncbi:hypothetical protein ACCO45_011356 [Purpureocillium lilacinum]|uniref:Uncharacterized protein n=1 Tax=Purpureocillium lilacinum TaxID=33203 RepID=A0ACC4DKE8_PURLI